ncbi:MAG: hypothetical protein JWO67_2888 [Streptosporangiaceae bacterium]|nr:hypothetical protein [Streptosporangiaceae bacterium]
MTDPAKTRPARDLTCVGLRAVGLQAFVGDQWGIGSVAGYQQEIDRRGPDHILSCEGDCPFQEMTSRELADLIEKRHLELKALIGEVREQLVPDATGPRDLSGLHMQLRDVAYVPLESWVGAEVPPWDRVYPNESPRSPYGLWIGGNRSITLPAFVDVRTAVVSAVREYAAGKL